LEVHLRPPAATCLMAAAGNHLRPNEEEWRDLFNNLCTRFPTVDGAKVAKILRERGGHGGEAASALRDMTSSIVKEPDPDDVEHVATLLSSAAMFKHACHENFKKYDVNKDGALEWDEVKALTNGLYDEFGLQPPSEGSLKAFFLATDENQDGVLSEREFRKFFEMFLRYAFFDHLKLRQMVEKGKAIEESGYPQMSEEREVDASPQDSRASSASEGTKPSKTEEQEAPAVQQSHSNEASVQPKAGRRSSPPAEDKKERSHRHRSDRPPPDSEGSGMVMHCLAPNGAAFRNSADFNDRKDIVCGKGQTVQVLEHWVRTPDGWLPMMDPQGKSLFEMCNTGSTGPTDNGNGKKRVSIRERKVSRDSKEDTLDVSVKTASHSPQLVEPEGSGLKSSEEEWRPVYDRLTERFPNLSQDKIVQALRDNSGHAGKAASMLRYM